jgi:malate dehydrogenase
MFSKLARNTAIRKEVQRGYKVAVMGASGGIGQPLALLMKLDPRVSDLSLYDVVRTPGVAADISHCCTPAKCTGYTGPEEVAASLDGAKVVIIPAGGEYPASSFVMLTAMRASDDKRVPPNVPS